MAISMIRQNGPAASNSLYAYRRAMLLACPASERCLDGALKRYVSHIVADRKGRNQTIVISTVSAYTVRNILDGEQRKDAARTTSSCPNILFLLARPCTFTARLYYSRSSSTERISLCILPRRRMLRYVQAGRRREPRRRDALRAGTALPMRCGTNGTCILRSRSCSVGIQVCCTGALVCGQIAQTDVLLGQVCRQACVPPCKDR